MELYRHSGKLSPLGIPVTLLFGTATACGLGLLYGSINNLVPFIKLKVLICVLCGIAIGWSIGHGVRIGKIRNMFVAGVYGVFFGLLGVYFAWVADFWLREVFTVEAFRFDVLEKYIAWGLDNGFWSLDNNHGNPANAAQAVKGEILAAFWIAEALIIIGFSTYWSVRSLAKTPFCEACDTWTSAVSPAKLLTYDKRIMSELCSGNLGALGSAAETSGNDAFFVQLDLHKCPNCQESSYMMVYQVTRKISQGKPVLKRKPVLRFLRVSPAEVAMIRAAGRVEQSELTNLPASPFGSDPNVDGTDNASGQANG